MAEAPWLVAGLGNPGPVYAGNRHNIGFMVAEELRQRIATPPRPWRFSEQFQAELLQGALADRAVLLLRPQTYMNLSGRAVGPLCEVLEIPPEQLVVVHDDVDLTPGRLKVKKGGGSGGHRGLCSLEEHLGSRDFYRVRCGVGHPGESGEAMIDYVLSDFTAAEGPTIEALIERAAEAVVWLLREGLRATMNRYNGMAAATAEA